MTTLRCSFLKNSAAAALVRINFAPQQGAWRTFEFTTRIDLAMLDGIAQVTLPVPSVNRHYQQSLQSSF